MKNISRRLKYRIALVAGLSGLLLFTLFYSLYFPAVNIYGEFKISVFAENRNITSEFRCEGITFFKHVQEINMLNNSLYNEKSSYKELRIYSAESREIKEEILSIVFTDRNDSVIKKIIISNRDISAGAIVISKLYEDDFINKLLAINPFNIALKNKVIFAMVILFVAIIAVVFVISFGEKFKIQKVTSSKIVFFLFLLAAFIFGLISIIHIVVIDKFFLYTGLLLQLSIFFLFLAIGIIFRRKMSRKIGNYTTLFLSSFFVIIVAELFLRIFGIGITYNEANSNYYQFLKNEKHIEKFRLWEPNIEIELSSPEFAHSRSTNSLGLSDKEPLSFKNDNHFLIIGLGDSFTEGVGAHADSTWLKFLESNLEIQDSCFEFIFINGGISGSDPVHQFVLLKDKLLNYEPDLVIVTIGYDLQDIILRGGLERLTKLEVESTFLENIKEYLYSLSFTYRLILHRVFSYNYLLQSPKVYEKNTIIAMHNIREVVHRFKEVSIENAFELIVVFYPERKEVLRGEYIAWTNLISVLKEDGFHVVDLLNYYLNNTEMNQRNVFDYYWKNDGHHNAKGYSVFGDGIYKSLLKFGILPPCDSIAKPLIQQ